MELTSCSLNRSYLTYTEEETICHSVLDAFGFVHKDISLSNCHLPFKIWSSGSVVWCEIKIAGGFLFNYT